MAYSNPISNDQLNSVKVLLKRGHSIRYIKKQVGVSVRKISEIRNSLGPLPTIAKTGRPAILKSCDLNSLGRSIVSGAISNAIEVTKMLQIDHRISVCAQTTRRALSNDNIKKG